MDFCEKHGLDYQFGVTGTKALAAKIEDIVDPIRVERAQTLRIPRHLAHRDHHSP